MRALPRLRWVLPALSGALPLMIIFIAVLSVPLTATQALGMTTAQTASWIMVVYGLPSVLVLALAIHYRQPLMLTGNLFAITFVTSLTRQLTYPEIIGAFIVAGAGVLIVGLLGLTGWLAAWIPAPVVLGLLAGTTIPFITGLFTSLGNAPLLVGATLLAYLLSRGLLGRRLPPILPALITGLIVTALTGQFRQPGAVAALPRPVLTLPAFTPEAIVTAVPVLIVIITLQSNVPSLLLLREQGYDPPKRVIDLVSGLGMIVGSLLGPVGVSLALPAVSIIGGERAGPPAYRYRAAIVAAAWGIALALLAGLAATLPAVVPAPLLLSLAGLALIDVLTRALQRATQGPLLLGPLFAFVISISELSLLGLNRFFWALVIGTAVSLLVERQP